MRIAGYIIELKPGPEKVDQVPHDPAQWSRVKRFYALHAAGVLVAGIAAVLIGGPV
jgi:hypothetical protein